MTAEREDPDANLRVKAESIIGQQIGPFVEARLRSKGHADHSESCAPPFNRRLKHVQPMLASAPHLTTRR